MIALTPIAVVIAVVALLICFLGYSYFTAGTTTSYFSRNDTTSDPDAQNRDSSHSVTAAPTFVNIERKMVSSHSERRSVFTR